MTEQCVRDQSGFTCRSEQRRHKVREAGLNGLDYLDEIDPLTLRVYFLGKAPAGLKRENVRIRGGRRVRDIQVTRVRMCTRQESHLDDCMMVTLDKTGDASTYTLCIIAQDDQGQPTETPFPGFDIHYSSLDFNFKIDCAGDLDCRPAVVCPPAAFEAPDINYLAKDYAGFRQLILDRLALIMPDWQERHAPDLGMALVEVLAYAGDYLSYYQDAVATEAYLDTARQRISVRRHARLVDYQMHEGCNARAWVHIQTSDDIELEPAKLAFITGHNQALAVSGRILTWRDLVTVPAEHYEVFEPLVQDPKQNIQLRHAHNAIRFWTWGDRACCLPQGATRATLVDGKGILVEFDAKDTLARQTPVQQQIAQEKPAPTWTYQRELKLAVGDVLIFEEVKGPLSGKVADADPDHRHVVRLTSVRATIDELYHQPLLEIAWAAADALPFPFCISAIGPAEAGCEMIEDISIARGNVILADHGQHIEDESHGCVPGLQVETICKQEGEPAILKHIPGVFHPRLDRTPLTFRQPFSGEAWLAPATAMLYQDPRKALPDIDLQSLPLVSDEIRPLFPPEAFTSHEALTALAANLRQSLHTGKQPVCHPDQDFALWFLRTMLSATTRQSLDEWDGSALMPGELKAALEADLRTLLRPWEVRRDLLASNYDHPHFVVEIDNEGRANLRFGDGQLGKQPKAGTTFIATYRVGNGRAGNVGAETLSHVVYRDLISDVDLHSRNPMPATGGSAPEPMAEVKLFAPHAFRTELQRAVTADDYAAIVMRDFPDRVQRAIARLRWNGSWYEALVVIDPHGETEAGADLLRQIEAHLYPYRRIGHDLVVVAAEYVPLDIEMSICVLPAYLRGHVKAALLDRFSNRQLPGGALGFFHPDNLSFGQPVHLSRLIAAAQAIPGVESVRVTKLERLSAGPNGELEAGLLPLGPLEIPRVDNDPVFPEHGRLKFKIGGGR